MKTRTTKISFYLRNTLLITTFSLLSLISTKVMAKLSYSDINDFYYKSYNYEASGNYSDAAKVITPILKEYPDTYTINARMGYLSLMNNNTANAISFYEKAEKAVKTALDPKLGLMLIYLQQGKYDKVVKYGMDVTTIDYYNYYGNLRFAVALRLQKKFTEAENILVMMLSLYPADTTYLTEYGTLEFAMGQNQKALSALNSVITLDPNNVAAIAILNTIAEAEKKQK